MKKLLLIAFLAVTGMARAQSDEDKAWMAYMIPGKEHQMLADENGTWTAQMSFWQPDQPEAMKATVTAQAKMILGGRYQQMDYAGDMMGMPFEGRSTVAFDNATKQYISTWIDNMGTGIMVMHGEALNGGRTIIFKGETVDPATGKPIKMREVYTIVDKNTRKMEMFDTRDGKEFKNMEILLKRK